MSFKAAENNPPKLELPAEPAKDQSLDRKIYLETLPDPSATLTPPTDTTNPNLPDATKPFAPAFNDIHLVDPKGKTGDVQIVDPKGTGATDALVDPFAPQFNVPGKPGDAPKGKDTVKGPETNLPPELTVDPFDPFKDWNSVPGLVPMDPKVDTKDTTVKPGPDVPKPELPKPADTVVKPVEPASPSDKVVPKPTDKVEPNPVFNENNVGEAIKLAAAKNQPIIVISTPNGQVGDAEKAAMQANASDAVFVNVNFQNADQMMRRGLETTHYWQLANLCGAAGDINNLYQKPGFVGRFNASDFKQEDPKGSLKAVAANDNEKVFGAMVKPPAPGPIAPGPVKPEGKVEPPVPPAVPGPDGKVVPPKDAPPVVQPKDAPAQPENKGPVKLDKADFTEADADKAVQYAKDNNLPLIVYKGAKSCGNCPTTRGNMEAFGREIQGKAATEAVVLRMDWDNLENLQRSNPAAAKVVETLVPPGTGFPNVAVYNPNDLGKPLGDVYGSQMSEIRGLLKTGQDAMKTTTGGDTKPVTPAPVKTDKPAEIVIDPNAFFNPEPSAVLNPQVKPGGTDKPVAPVVPPKDAPVQPKDAPAQPEKKGPTKLDKADFTSADADKAIQFAKDNNLPLIVYRGSADCPRCPTTRANMEQFGKEIEGKPATDAVVLRLDWSQLNNLEQTNPAAAKAMRDVVAPGTSFPNVAVFNPNNLSRPLSTTYGSRISEIRSLVKTGQDSLNLTTGGDKTKAAAPTVPSAFNESNILSATKAASEKNIPMIAYVDQQADPKMATALKYLQDNGLATTVSISDSKAQQMFRNGLESTHFHTLQNAMKPAQGTTVGARLNSFSPESLKAGQQLRAGRSADAKASADQVVSFLKDSGVDLSKNNSEAAVRALLDGAPIPPAPKPEAPPVPEVKKPDAPAQPEVKKPDAPAQPEVKKPDAPAQPEVKKPDAPAQPEVKKPDAPAQPEVKKPDAPAQPEVKKPDAPAQPEEKPIAPPQVEKPETPAPFPKLVGPTLPMDKPSAFPKLFEPGEIIQTSGEKVDAKNEFKAKTADDALKIIEDAKKRNLPLVVHSMTVICTDQTCTPTEMPPGLPSQFGDKALFMELPRSGVKVPEGAQYDELRAINELYKTTLEDHKTELDLHVFKMNDKTSKYELNDGEGRSNRSLGDFIKARLEAAKKESKEE